jgi:hypothetical protein
MPEVKRLTPAAFGFPPAMSPKSQLFLFAAPQPTPILYIPIAMCYNQDATQIWFGHFSGRQAYPRYAKEVISLGHHIKVPWLMERRLADRHGRLRAGL